MNIEGQDPEASGFEQHCLGGDPHSAERCRGPGLLCCFAGELIGEEELRDEWLRAESSPGWTPVSGSQRAHFGPEVWREEI